MTVTRLLSVLLVSAFVVCALPVEAQDREDPYGSLKRAELATAHAMIDDLLADTLTKQMEATLSTMMEDAPLDAPLRGAFHTAFHAGLPKLVVAMQDWFAQAVVDEFTYVELLYPATIAPERWSDLSAGSRDAGIELGMAFMIGIIEDVCGPEETSEFCVRARTLVEKGRIEALADDLN